MTTTFFYFLIITSLVKYYIFLIWRWVDFIVWSVVTQIHSISNSNVVTKSYLNELFNFGKIFLMEWKWSRNHGWGRKSTLEREKWELVSEPPWSPPIFYCNGSYCNKELFPSIIKNFHVCINYNWLACLVFKIIWQFYTILCTSCIFITDLDFPEILLRGDFLALSFQFWRMGIRKNFRRSI